MVYAGHIHFVCFIEIFPSHCSSAERFNNNFGGLAIKSVRAMVAGVGYQSASLTWVTSMLCLLMVS